MEDDRGEKKGRDRERETERQREIERVGEISLKYYTQDKINEDDIEK